MTKELKHCRKGDDRIDMAVSEALKQMVGAKIIDAGFFEKLPGKVMEGGLAFDYEKDSITKRIVFGYNELGEWIESHEEIK